MTVNFEIVPNLSWDELHANEFSPFATHYMLNSLIAQASELNSIERNGELEACIDLLALIANRYYDDVGIFYGNDIPKHHIYNAEATLAELVMRLHQRGYVSLETSAKLLLLIDKSNFLTANRKQFIAKIAQCKGLTFTAITTPFIWSNDLPPLIS